MHITDYLEMYSSARPQNSSTECFTTSLARRVRCEGLSATSAYATRVHKTLMQFLASGVIDTDNPDYRTVQRVLREEGPVHALNMTGALSRVIAPGIKPVADYDGFKARCVEATNHRGEYIAVPSVFRAYVAATLGPAPTDLRCKHGPGATSDRMVGWDKWLCLQTLDPFRPIRVATLTDVPKDIFKRRLIAMETAETQFLQQGVARALRATPLFRSMTTLENHRRHLALACSPRYMTIDLSDASDRVTWAIVESLLPPDWVDLFGRFSSGVARFPDGTTLSTGMAATMGCGFCFELESLIHGLLIVLSMCTGGESFTDLANIIRQISVYGDDIVMPREWYPDVLPMFSLCGVVINPKKTCLTTRFRETVGYWIIGSSSQTGTATRRFLPQLTLDESGNLILDARQALDLAARAQDASYETLSTGLLLGRRWRVRHNQKLWRLEVQVPCETVLERALNVVGETRLNSWLLTGTSPLDTRDPKEAIPGVTRTSLSWIPVPDGMGRMMAELSAPV